MKPKDDLHRLIKSLSQGEKRQFKLSALPGSKNKNYLRLFDAIDHQDEYDETKIKKKFSGETFIRHLPSEKNYLQNIILKMLRNDEDESIQHELLLAASEVETLFSKKLFDLALEKAGKFALEAERLGHFGVAQELLLRERTIFAWTNREHLLERYNTWEKDFERVLEKQENVFSYAKMGHRMSQITVFKGAMITKDEIEECKRLVTTGVMEDIRHAKSSVAVLFFYSFRLNYYSVANDLENGLNYARLQLNHYSDHPYLMRRSPNNYLGALSTYITYLFATNRLEEARTNIELLGRFPKPYDFRLNPSAELFKFQREIPLRMELMIRLGDSSSFKNDIQHLRKIINQKNVGTDELSVVSAHFHLGQLFFVYQEYREAIKEFSWLIEYGKKELIGDYKTTAKILIALSHIEKGTPDIVPYLYKKFKFQSLKGAEKLLADFFCKTLINVNSSRDLIQLLPDFKKAYLSYSEHSGIEHYFEFISWIDSKLEGKTMAEIMKEKIGK